MEFWKKRKEEKLYKQWVQYNGLPSEAIPQRGEADVGRGKREEKGRTYQYREKLLAVMRKLLKV